MVCLCEIWAKGRWGGGWGWGGAGKGTGKSMRTRYPLANYPLVSPRNHDKQQKSANWELLYILQRGLSTFLPLCLCSYATKSLHHLERIAARPRIPCLYSGVISFCQEPRKGGFSKGGFCRVQCHGQRDKKYPRILAPAVHLALRAPQPREAYIVQKPRSKNPLFLVLDLVRAPLAGIWDVAQAR